MTLFGPLFAPRAASLENPQTPISAPQLVGVWGDSPTAAGVAVTEEKSLALPAVWCAVGVISGTIASLPLHAYRAGDTEGRVQVNSGAAAALLGKPHPDLTPYEVVELTVVHLLLWGNAYLWKVRNALGEIVEMWPMHPGRIKAGRAKNGTKVYLVDGTEPATDYEFLHIPGLGYDGVTGCSPVRLAKQGLGLALAAEEFGAKLFGSGSLATGILQTEQRLTPAQAEQTMARWSERYQGLKSAHSTIMLDSGLKFHQLTIPPEDAQFLESRSFQVSEIARIFRVPPHMLMDTDKATSWGTGIEQQSIGFVVYTLRPWLTRIEQRLSGILRPEEVYARFSVEGLLRGDSAGRKDFYAGMWQLGAFSTNEIRALEEMGPVEGGDVRYRPLNMGVLGTSDETTQPAGTAG